MSIAESNGGELVPDRAELTKELFFYGPSPAVLSRLGDELKRRGILVPVEPRRAATAEELEVFMEKLRREKGIMLPPEPPSGAGQEWSLTAYGSDAELQASDAWSQLEALAERHGATFDGWGTYVGPLKYLRQDEPDD